MWLACLSALPTWVPWAGGQRGDGVEAAPASSLTQVLAPAYAADLPPARSRGERGGESAPCSPSVEGGRPWTERPTPVLGHRPGCVLRRDAHLLHMKRGEEGGNGRGAGAWKWEGPRHRWAGGFKKLVGEAWHGNRWPWEWRLQEGPPPRLLVGAAFEALGWECRPDSGGRAQVVPKGCSINGDAGQASRWA